MKNLPILALILALASCAPSIPRAILPPPSVIAQLDVEPVAKASTATRTAVREIAKAGTETRKATDSLRDQIDRTAEIAAPYPDLREAFAEMRRRADLLAARVAFAEEKEAIAIATVDELTAEVSALQSTSAAQSVQIRTAQTTEATLREQVQALSTSSDKLAIAQDNLDWWRWRFAPVNIGLLALLLLALIYRPRIPFLP